ncbi:MAG: hypothetical protein OHK0052_03870 [Anaerolineales bacterium]
MPEKKSKQAEPFEPKGTLLIMLIFLVTLVVLWGSIYFILLSRGVTL